MIQGLKPRIFVRSYAALKRRSPTFLLGFASRDGRMRPSPHVLNWPLIYAALPGPLASEVLPSIALPLPTFTLICFGFASAFLGKEMFSTPLS